MRLIEHFSNPDKQGEIKIGQSMTIHPTIFMDSKARLLSDGLLLRPGHRIGRIHILENLPVLGPDENLIGAIRRLYNSTADSLAKLAELCQNDDRRLSRIKAFYGISHLARFSAGKLGFDVFDIENNLIRGMHHKAGFLIALKTAGDNKEWQKTIANFKPPREAIISRAKLVELYGK